MRPTTSTSLHSLHERVIGLLASRYAEALTLSSLAAELASSPRQIQRALAFCGKTTFTKELTAQRMSTAAELLSTQTELTVAEVGRLVGYPRGTYFARVFRAHHGVSPGQFRARASPQVQRSPPGGTPASAVPPGRGPPSTPAALSCSSVSDSRPGSRNRISVPPPGAGSAVIAPPCCAAT